MNSETRSPDTGSEDTKPALSQGTYEIIRDRLFDFSRQLGEKAAALNAQRLKLFGSAEMTVTGNERIRTENNCVPRDIVSVGNILLFGYNVFIGLKSETSISDVFSLYTFEQTDSGYTISEMPFDAPDNFLNNESFQKDFRELYQYYKNAYLLQLRRTNGKMLAIFQTGESSRDIKVFRWTVDFRNKVRYIDNRGERDHVFPHSFDFEWTVTTRDDYVEGRHPHVSILDQVFVETVGGDLTVKVEDNTEDGLGIYREPVEDADQSLDDGEIHYAVLGGLILLKIKPFREEQWRYLVFNTRTQSVDRIDAIGHSCIQLPEDHGIIFPGGYCLQSGERKVFEGSYESMKFKRFIRSPNGEDVLFIFYHHSEGRAVLLPYNMIRKAIDNPVPCHGFSLFDNGTMILFRALTDEPTRVHNMQIWQTPFMTDEHAAKAPSTGSFLEKIGNADLVRGISDMLSIRRAVEEQQPTLQIYEDLIRNTNRVMDAYYWLDNKEIGNPLAILEKVRETAESIVDEFEKVQEIKQQSARALAETEENLSKFLTALKPESWTSVDQYVETLSQLRIQRGHLITLRDRRYIDLERITELEEQVIKRFDTVSAGAVDFLVEEDSLKPYHDKIDKLMAEAAEADAVTTITPYVQSVDTFGEGLDVLTAVVGDLKIDDARIRTDILEKISEMLAHLNRARAVITGRRKELLSKEAVAEFAIQFKLFGQNVVSALNMADTPEKCDAELSKLMLRLEELESQFSEFDDYLAQLATKREDVYESFSSKKQVLLDKRQRRAEHLMQAAERILQGISRRVQSLNEDDALHAYFATDPMVAKIRDIGERLRDLHDSVRADELGTRLKSVREESLRSLRDRQEIFEEGAAVIKFGKHRFSVNTQPLDLTIVPRSGGMALHLAGTDFYEQIMDEEFGKTRMFWDQEMVSETGDVYRAEYLAYSILDDAEQELNGLTIPLLQKRSLENGGLLQIVRDFSQEKYNEGYDRGVHDADAALILEKLLHLYTSAELLRFEPTARGLAVLFRAFYDNSEIMDRWQIQARSLGRVRQNFGRTPAIKRFTNELAGALADFLADQGIELHLDRARLAGLYLFEELAESELRFVVSAEATTLQQRFLKNLEESGSLTDFEADRQALSGELAAAFYLLEAWLTGFLDKTSDESILATRPVLYETVALFLTENKLEREVSNALGSLEIKELLGQHDRINKGTLHLRLDEFLSRLSIFRLQRVPAYRDYLKQRHELLERERTRLRLSEYEPRVMTSFVRNRLINEVYLPLIGDNLAKQIGVIGDETRTDRMGLLLLVSPPGYGKTTLMEYLANRLGIIFMKVNGPALGHNVTSLDPAEAPNATARQEVEKINLAFEMGNNVMLYLDDIQHTSSELLQKFISLCDAQRRVEGVWRNRTRTYDFRGKRFCVVMAGNPYTESGERFQIPDMLANRADTYNLGDILEGRDEQFALSYLENSLTSNSTLSPLMTRDIKDFYKIVKMAQGEDVQADQLAYHYSSAEVSDMVAVVKKLFAIQGVVLKVNQQYIYSASQADDYRTEPPFKLQGSYRNMNKMAEKVVAVMNDDELQALLDDHYLGEAQTLTSESENNLLKLAELRGTMTDEQNRRWDEVKKAFSRVQAMGRDDDPVARVTGQLGLLTSRIEDIGEIIEKAAQTSVESASDAPDLVSQLAPFWEDLKKNLEQLTAVQKSLAAEKDDSAINSAILKQTSQWRKALLPPLTAMTDKLTAEAETDDGKDLKLIAKQLSKLSRNLTDIGKHLAEGTAVSVPSVQTPVTTSVSTTGVEPYLDKLDQTLQALATAPRSGQVIQSLTPGVLDLLQKMVSTIEGALLPTTQAIDKLMSQSVLAADRKMEENMARSLKNLDMLKDLLKALISIDTGNLSSSQKTAPKKSTRKKQERT